MEPISIKEMLGKVLDDKELTNEDRRDVIFHMTDWLKDLSELHALYEAPENFRVEEAHSIVMGFLIHAPNHLAAASKLWLDIPVQDVFGVGSTTKSADDDAT